MYMSTEASFLVLQLLGMQQSLQVAGVHSALQHVMLQKLLAVRVTAYSDCRVITLVPLLTETC